MIFWLGAVQSAHAVKYEVVDLGLGSIAALNGKGDTVGYKFDDASGMPHAMVWNSTGLGWDLHSDIGALGSMATSINDAGEVAGQSIGDTFRGVWINKHPFVWSPSSGLKTPASIPTDAYSLEINNQGNMVGVGTGPSLYSQPFVWTPEGLAYLTPNADQSIRPSTAHINSKGDVVGGSSVIGAFGVRVAYHWSATSGYRLISSPSSAYPDITLNAINDSGQAVGYIENYGKAKYKPVTWTASGGVRVVPLWSYADQFNPRSSNKSGVIVGNREADLHNPVPSYWTLWGGLRDVNTMLVKKGPAVVVKAVVAINDAGQIAAVGTVGGDAGWHALLLIPKP